MLEIVHYLNMAYNLLITGERIKELRLERKLTMVQLATAIGTKHGLVSRWESGHYAPSPGFIYELSKFFNISADYLLGLVD